MKNTGPEGGIKFYIVGGGIAGLASAVYLIREGRCPGGDITIFDGAGISGGALDGSGSAENGYLIRGGRMHERHFVCTWDLLSAIPSLEDPAISVKEEVFAFNGNFQRATALHCHRENGPEMIELAAGDRLFVTLGSMVERSATGGMTTPAPLRPKSATGLWALWERIAAKGDAFGRPRAFCEQVAQSKWMSFTVTLKDPTFFEYMERFTGNRLEPVGW